MTDTGSLEPSAEALAWQRRADAWAQQAESHQSQTVEPASRWSEVASTGRPTFPADGVGWRTETAEWRAATARWRQTTEWHSTSGTHGWRSTTEAWQTGGNRDGIPPASTPTQQPAISAAAWPTRPDTPDETPPPPSHGWQQPADTRPTWQQSADTGSWQQGADARPAWQQVTEPSYGQQPAPPARQQPTPQPPTDSPPSWQRLIEPTGAPSWQTSGPAGTSAGPLPSPSWNTPAPSGPSPAWQRDPIEGSATWTDAGNTPSTTNGWRPGGTAEPPNTWQSAPSTETASWQSAPGTETASWRSTPATETASWRSTDNAETTSWQRGEPPSWQTPRDDGRHLVREDDRAAWQRDADLGDTYRQAGHRRAAEGPRTSGGTGWAARSEADNWAGHTDTGDIPAFTDPPAPQPPTWGARAEAYPDPAGRRPQRTAYGMDATRADGYRDRTAPGGHEAAGHRAGPTTPYDAGQQVPARDQPAGDIAGRNSADGRPGVARSGGFVPTGRSPVARYPQDDRPGTPGGPLRGPDDPRFVDGSGPRSDQAQGAYATDPRSRQAPMPSRPRYNQADDDWHEHTGTWESEPDTSRWVRDPDTGQWSRAEDDPRIQAWREETARREATQSTGRRELPAAPDDDSTRRGMAVGPVYGRQDDPAVRRDWRDDTSTRGFAAGPVPRSGMPASAPRSGMPGGAPSGGIPAGAPRSGIPGAPRSSNRDDDPYPEDQRRDARYREDPYRDDPYSDGRRRAAGDPGFDDDPLSPDAWLRGTDRPRRRPARDEYPDDRDDPRGGGSGARFDDDEDHTWPPRGAAPQRPQSGGWRQAERDQTERGSATYREGGTGDWRRALATVSDLSDGESRRYGTDDFVPFRPSGSAAVPRGSNLSMTSTSLLMPAGGADPAAVARGGFLSPSGSYERRPVDVGYPAGRRSATLDPDDEEDDQSSGGPLAAVGYTVIWYGVPVVLFVFYMLVVNNGSQAHALGTLGRAAPQFGISLVLSMIVAVGLRWASSSWKAVSVGLAAAVVGGGLATVLSSAITGNSLS